jgi:hypothetical protein
MAETLVKGEDEFKVLGGALLFEEDYDGVKALIASEEKAGRKLGFAEAVARYVRDLRESKEALEVGRRG